MMTHTLAGIRALLQTDGTVSAKDRGMILEVVKGHGQQSKTKDDKPELARIVTRAEAAKLLGATTRLVDKLGQEGTLQRVMLPGRSRGCGYRMQDLQQLIEGGKAVQHDKAA